MNIVKDVAKLLGIEVGVPFHVNEEKIIYRFDEDGAFSWDMGDGDWSRDLVLTGHFLRGMLTVKWKPKCGEYYHYPDVWEENGISDCVWADDKEDKLLYDRGLVFRTEEEAAAKAKEYGWIK